MLEKCEGILKSPQIIDMPNAIVHSDLSKMVCKVLQHIWANRIVPRPQQKKAIIHSVTSGRKDFEKVRKGQEELKIFKSNWSRYLGRDMSIHKSQLVSKRYRDFGKQSIYLSIYLSTNILYVYYNIICVMYIINSIYIHIYT